MIFDMTKRAGGGGSGVLGITQDANGYLVLSPTSGGGGGGVTTLASGTVTGSGTSTLSIPVGKKMAQTDFIFNCWVTSGTEITPGGSVDRMVVIVQNLAKKGFAKFDLSTDGTKNATGQATYPTDNGSGTKIDRTPNPFVTWGSFVRQGSVASETFGMQIVRASTGFSLNIGKNSQYPFQSGITYNWEILYIGSDPSTDIVEVP